MDRELFTEKVFKGEDFTENPLKKADYEQCQFANCTFHRADLSHVNFLSCEFKNCDLGLGNVNMTSFKKVGFRHCKLIGLLFEKCNPFLLAVDFEQCQLDLASFARLNLKNCRFRDCSLQEVEFLGADLSGLSMGKSNLLRANFHSTDLRGTDFREAYHYSINPEYNLLIGAKFSQSGVAGLLDHLDIEIVQ